MLGYFCLVCFGQGGGGGLNHRGDGQTPPPPTMIGLKSFHNFLRYHKVNDRNRNKINLVQERNYCLPKMQNSSCSFLLNT